VQRYRPIAFGDALMELVILRLQPVVALPQAARADRIIQIQEQGQIGEQAFGAQTLSMMMSSCPAPARNPGSQRRAR
jgi:hypothetical protein